MAQKTNKSYREPYIGMKIVAGTRGVFTHTIVVKGFDGENALLGSYPENGLINRTPTKVLVIAIKEGFWAELIQFKDYYEAIQKRTESNL